MFGYKHAQLTDMHGSKGKGKESDGSHYRYKYLAECVCGLIS